MGLVGPVDASPPVGEVIHVGHVNIIKVSDYVTMPKPEITFVVSSRDDKPKYTPKYKAGFVAPVIHSFSATYYIYGF